MHKVLPFLLIAAIGVLSVLLLKDDLAAWSKARKFANSPAKNELLSQSFVDRILLSDGQFNSEDNKSIWFGKEVETPNNKLAALINSEPSSVLGDNTGEKWIDIDLSTQRLYAKEGDRTIMEFPISSGLPWFATVTGEFRIWAKVRAQRMSGGSVADGTYYDLANVPFVQYFHKGYGIHGAYWHNDFGKPRSHGCINMRINDAQALFYWTNPPLPDNLGAIYKITPESSTRVVVRGSTPSVI